MTSSAGVGDPTLCEGADDGQCRGAIGIGIIEGLPRPYRLDVRAVHGSVAKADSERFLLGPEILLPMGCVKLDN